MQYDGCYRPIFQIVRIVSVSRRWQIARHEVRSSIRCQGCGPLPPWTLAPSEGRDVSERLGCKFLLKNWVTHHPVQGDGHLTKVTSLLHQLLVFVGRAASFLVAEAPGQGYPNLGDAPGPSGLRVCQWRACTVAVVSPETGILFLFRAVFDW